MCKSFSLIIVFAIFAWTASLNIANAYDCPTTGCYGYTANQAQGAYNLERQQYQMQQQTNQILQNQQDQQNQVDQLQQQQNYR